MSKRWTKYAIPVAIGLGAVVITHLINRRKVAEHFSAPRSWSYFTNKFGTIGPPVPEGYGQKIVTRAQEFADKAVVVDYLDRDTVVNLIWNLGLGNLFSEIGRAHV